MRISLNFIVRIVGMLSLAALGFWVGRSLSGSTPAPDDIFATRLLTLAGAGLGLIVTPWVTIEPIQDMLRRMRTIPLPDMLVAASGGLIGLIFAVLLSVPLAFLPPPVSQFLPLLTALLFAYLGVMLFWHRRRDIADMLRSWRRTGNPAPPIETADRVNTLRYLVDTSAIIDGRIAAVVQTGFVEGTLLVPSFVLTELQSLADSADDLRRAKGRRGLELLSQMQKDSPLPVEIISVDVSGSPRVDDKLIILARQYRCPIITNDFNLNRVAGLQGVKVLSLNQLSEAVRPPVMQDQRLSVLIRNEGNARQQGVGYLADGTPVIVEEARHLIGKHVDIVVTRLHQTQTGRLVFAQLANVTPADTA